MNQEQEALNLLLKNMKEVSDEKLDDTFIGALKFNSDQKNVVNFVFWLCYMTESDLDAVLKKAWELSSSFFPPETVQIAKKMIAENLKGYAEEKADIKKFIKTLNLEPDKNQKILDFVNKNYSNKRVFNGVEDLPYFMDKIKVYELFYGGTKRTKLLYKINGIRNDLSHNRINDLKYNGKSLFLRTTKEELITDYFDSAFNNDKSKSEFLNDLTPEQKAQIEEIVKNNPIDIKDME